MSRLFRAFLALSVLIAAPLAAQMSFTTPGAVASGGTGTVTSVGVTTANGVSGAVANPTTTPAITVSLGAITPSSVASPGTVTGSNLSGTNTGDQTTVSGAAGSVTNAVTFDNSGSGVASGATFNGSAARTVSTNTLGALKASNNLSDVTASTARTNLGLGTAATQSTGTFLQTANNLSDVAALNTTIRNLQSCYVVGQSAVAQSVTGTTTETTLATFTLPVMGANDELRIETLWGHTGTAGAWTAKVKLGTTVVEGLTNMAAANLSANLYQLVANRNATNSQVFYTPTLGANQGTTTTAISTSGEETNAGATITMTGTLGNTGDSMRLERYLVTLCPKA